MAGFSFLHVQLAPRILSCCMLLFVVVRCCMLLYVVVCCCMLLYVVVCCCMLLYVVVCCCMLLYVVVCCCMLLYVVVCCCMLLYVVVCCCMLLYVVVLLAREPGHAGGVAVTGWDGGESKRIREALARCFYRDYRWRAAQGGGSGNYWVVCSAGCTINAGSD